MEAVNPTAFDAFAGDYDTAFTDSRLGRMLRRRVWDKLAHCFQAGQHVLDLACGTGADAVWLARRNVRVTATDGSRGMVEVTAAKAKKVGVATAVETRHLSLQAIAQGQLVETFDGLYANFGGLNTIHEWRPLAQALAAMVKPGGKVVLVPMGPFCPWEVAWYLLHRQPRVALRRFKQPAMARIGHSTIPIWYPSPRRLRRDFAPWFQHRQTESLGLWLPPTYLSHLVDGSPNFFSRLNRLEKVYGRLSGGWGDHYIMILERGVRSEK